MSIQESDSSVLIYGIPNVPSVVRTSIAENDPARTGVGAVFAASEGADLSRSDLLDCLLDPRPSGVLTAVCQSGLFCGFAATAPR